MSLSFLWFSLLLAVPNPYAPTTEPTVGPAPVPVVEQVFYLQVNQPPQTAMAIDLPQGVTLLDRTRPREGQRRTRFYLRADRPVQAAVTLRVEGEAPVQVPLTVRSYREDIEHHVREVPGIDPSVRKGGRSFFTDDMIAQGKINLDRFEALRANLLQPTPFDAMSDEELFASLPSWNVPRQGYSNWPCPEPTCGEKIYRHSGFYPWRVEDKAAFKARCPDCRQLFPSNDWLGGDFTSGAYPDDGWGWDAHPQRSERNDHAGWIAHVNAGWWREVGTYLERLAFRYLLLDDQDAAHRAGVLLARMAYVYPGMNMRWQQVRSGYLRPGRLLVDGNWEREAILVPAAHAYDAIFNHLDADDQLAAFLGTKDPAIRSSDDVKQLLDVYLLQVFGWDWLRRELSGGGMGTREKNLVQFAVVADMGAMSDRWIEEVFTHAWNTGLDKGGFVDENMINSRVREGPPVIAGVGYATGYLRHLSEMAEILSRVRSPRWRPMTDLYDRVKYPKFEAEFATWVEFLVAGQFAHGYGDGGGGALHGLKYPRGLTYPDLTRWAYERAYRRWPTDQIARAIFNEGPPSRAPMGPGGLGTNVPAFFEPDVWPQVVEHVQRLDAAVPMPSRVIDGFGFVQLESRPDAEKLEDRAGLSLRYGYSRGHSHQDNLNVELYARGFCLTPELGYPTWTHRYGSTSHVAHHITGMIDRSPQYTTTAIGRGTLERFAGAPEASFAEVSATPQGFTNRVYRRAICLADAPDGNVYVFDVFRMAGGDVRTYCFHGPPFDGFETSVPLTPTGEPNFDVGPIGRNLENNILHPAAVTADSDLWADWKKKDHDLRFRLHLLAVPGRQYVAADYGKTDVPPVKFLFAEDRAADGASEFVSIWQPYTGEPFIEKIERLTVQGAAPGEFQPAAVRVHLKGGRVDTFIYTMRDDVALHVDDLEFRGAFGYWSQQDGALRAAHLVGGGHLHRGGEGITQMPAAFTTTIAAVDYDRRTITLAAAPPQREGLLMIQGGAHRTAYHIEDVDGATVRLRHNAIIFQSRLDGADGAVAECELPLSLEAGGGFPPGYYNGATLTNERGDVYYRVQSVDHNRIRVDRPIDAAAFTDEDGDGRALLKIYDFGPGDAVTLPRSVFVRP